MNYFLKKRNLLQNILVLEHYITFWEFFIQKNDWHVILTLMFQHVIPFQKNFCNNQMFTYIFNRFKLLIHTPSTNFKIIDSLFSKISSYIFLRLLPSQLYNFITHSTCSQQVFVGKNICLEHLVANLNPF